MSRRSSFSSQEKILQYIKKVLAEKGYPPTVREICEAVGLSSTSTVHAHLNNMEKRGLIRRDPTKPRAIEVLDAVHQARNTLVEVPVIGKVAAGIPILAVENIEESYFLPQSMLPSSSDCFMLTVQGESMINAGILNGDLVIVQPQSTAENGEIVVAMIDDEATVKRYYKENGHIRLQPENDLLSPIIVPSAEILGLVVGLYRRMH